MSRTADHRRYDRLWLRHRRAAGCCVQCGSRTAGTWYCRTCADPRIVLQTARRRAQKGSAA